MQWTVLLLSVPLLGITVDAKKSGLRLCATLSNPRIRGVEDPRAEWRTRRLLDIVANKLRRGDISHQAFIDLLALDEIELRRIERAWLDYFHRVGADQLVARYKVTEVIAKITALRIFERELKETPKNVENSRFNVTRVNEAINAARKKFETEPPELFSNCNTWLEMLEAHWQRFVHKKKNKDNVALAANLNALRDKTQQLQFNILAAASMERADHGEFPWEIRAKILFIQQRLKWIGKLFEQHLSWFGNVTSLFHDDKCATGRLVPAALDVAQLVIDAKQDFLLQHDLFITAKISKSALMQKTSQSLRSLVNADRQFTEILHRMDDKVYERILLGREVSRLEALIELQRRFMSRTEFYSDQKNSSYFENQIPALPIEKALDRWEKELKKAIEMHTEKCMFWSEKLDAKWRSYLATGTNETAIQQAFQELHQKAIELKSRVVKLEQEMPDEFSSYLRPETELELITAEKQYERLAVEFGQFIMRTQNVDSSDEDE